MVCFRYVTVDTLHKGGGDDDDDDDNTWRISSHILGQCSQFYLTNQMHNIKKAIPVTGLCGPEGSGRLRLPDF